MVAASNLGVWEQYIPSPFPEGIPTNVMFAKRHSDGLDWYTYSGNPFPANTVLAVAIQENGYWTIKNATRDYPRLWPAGMLLLSFIDDTQDDLLAKYAGKVWSGGNIIDRPVSKDDLKAYVAKRRWELEVGGVTWNGHTVSTDREASQPKLMAEFVAMIAGARTDPSLWKFEDGFESLTNVQMQNVCLLVRSHIATLFTAEQSIAAQVEVGTLTTTTMIDEAFASVQ